MDGQRNSPKPRHYMDTVVKVKFISGRKPENFHALL